MLNMKLKISYSKMLTLQEWLNTLHPRMKTNTTREDSSKELLDTSSTQAIKINKLHSENTHKIKINNNKNKNKINLLKSKTHMH